MEVGVVRQPGRVRHVRPATGCEVRVQGRHRHPRAAGPSACVAALFLTATLSMPPALRAQQQVVESDTASIPNPRARARLWAASGRLGDARAERLEALQGGSHDPRTLCELSWIELELGRAAQGEERRRLVAAAVEHARAAVDAAPDAADGHLALAVALDRQASEEGPRTRMSMEREVKAEVDRALEIDPDNAEAYAVRGEWHRRIAGLGILERFSSRAVLGGVPRGASMENAVRDFERAVALEPMNAHFRLELGRTYLRLDRDAAAREQLEKTLAIATTTDPAAVADLEEARDLLGRLRE